MTFISLLGVFLGISFIVWGILLKGGVLQLQYFLEPASLILVLGCSISALIINYPFKEVLHGLKGIKYLLKKFPVKDEEVIDKIVEIAAKARREGFLSLKDETTGGKIPLLDLGLGLLADGADSQTIKEILESSLSSQIESLSTQERVWRDFGVYTPMFGMMGTIIGLVLMLRGLTDPSTIGPAMALALLTTFYGILLAGILALPIAGKIRNYTMRFEYINTLIIEGIISIQQGDNSQIVREKLNARLMKNV